MTRYRAPNDQYRWLAIRNIDTEDMPPFACVWLEYATDFDGDAVWGARRPSAANKAGELAFNGPSIIPKWDGAKKYHFGKATVTYPTRGIFHKDYPLVGAQCGPVDGTWYLGPGNKFIVLDEDDIPQNSKGERYKWVSLLVADPEPITLRGIAQAKVAAGDVVPVGISGTHPIYHNKGFTYPASTASADRYKIKTINQGVYVGSLSALMQSEDAPNGTSLEVALVSGETSTPFRQVWLRMVQDVSGGYGRTWEFAGASHPFHVAAGIPLWVQNMSGYSMTFGDLQLSIHRLGATWAYI